MSASPVNTLFTTRPPSSTRPGSFMVSFVVHGILGIGALALMHTPKVAEAPARRRYTTLVVKLEADEPHLQWTPAEAPSRPTPHPAVHAKASGLPIPMAAAAPKSPARLISGPITLIQPDIPPTTSVPLKTPMPLVMMWTPHDLPVAKVVPPPPQIEAVNNVRPSLAMPNRELQAADMDLSSSVSVNTTIPIVAGTTSPIVTPRLEPMQVPQTASNASSSPPTPATVASVSDVLLSRGTVVLPPVNQSAATSNSDTLAPGQPGGTSNLGKGTMVGKQNGSATSVAPEDQTDSNKTGSVSGAGNNAKNTKSSSKSGSDQGLSPAIGASVDRITRPRDGHFGAVIVGGSVAEQYPEAAGIWADRLAYTVYLHVGAAKTWILQYCLPRTVQAAGNTSRPDAPWPYLMITPHLAPDDVDADALLVHGFIDAAGHFEKLSVVFPEPFAQSKFVLDALQQWEFRPASQTGQSTAVEVLLIIPSETNE